MQIVDVTKDNIAREHICCAITEKKGETCVKDKKAWLSMRFDDGLVFKKMAVRGKVFIEYIPAEKAWYPIEAPGYMHVDCIWVSGQYKKHGYSNQLLQACIDDAKAKGKLGLTMVSTEKKVPFISDGKYLKYKGFLVADTAPERYELLYLPFAPDAPAPKFRENAKRGRIDEQGMVVFYDDQCTYANTYALRIRETARQHGRELTLHKFETAEEAQQGPCPHATYSLYYNGEFVTNEILSEGRIEQFMAENPE